MAEPNKRPRLIRRTTPRFEQAYTAQPDAVNETLNVGTSAPRLIAARKTEADTQKRTMENSKRLQEARREIYRQNVASKSPNPEASYWLLQHMPEEEIDRAVLQEMQTRQREEQGPQLYQGYGIPDIDEDKLADQYATVSNFYSSLGSPGVMPLNTAQVRANPRIAAQQLQFGLDNPALAILQMASPAGGGTGATAAARTALRSSMQTAKPLAIRAAKGIGQAAKAGGRTLVQNAPKVAGNLAVMAVPTAAAAEATFKDEDPQGGGQGAPIVSLVTLGALGALGIRNWYKTGNPFRLTPKASTEASPYVYQADRRLLTWERPGNWETATREALQESVGPTVQAEWNAAIGDAAKESAFKTKYGLSTKSGRRTAPWTNQEVKEAISAGDFSKFQRLPQVSDYVLTGPTSVQTRGAYLRNFGRGVTGLGAAGIGYEMYNWLSGGNRRASSDSNTNEQPDLVSQGTNKPTADNTQPTDTFTRVPMREVPDTAKIHNGIVFVSTNDNN